MKKRLLSLFLVFLLSLTAVQVFAAGGDNTKTDITKVNLSPDCNFDVPINEDAVGNYYTSYGAGGTWSEDGANGTAGSLKVKVNSNWGYMYVPLPFQETIGETFDVYFWAKIGEDFPEKEFHMQPFCDGGWPYPVNQGDVMTHEWTKYHYVFTNTGDLQSGKPENATELRLASLFVETGLAPMEYYIDEIEIYARGNIDFNEYWSGLINEDHYPAETGFDDPQPIYDADFSDIDGHWAEDTVNVLATSGFVNGYEDGTYGPEKGVTRAEFIKLVMNMTRYDTVDFNGEFVDISADDWFADDVANAYSAGLINSAMIKDGAFMPNVPITREEAASVLLKVAEAKAKSAKKDASAFADDSSISSWAKEAVYAAAGYGLINGYPDGTFGPEKNITRAEAASVIRRTIELGGRMAYYVDGKNGNDSNDGSKNAPFKTIEAAKKYIQPHLGDMQSHINVYIKGGEYKLKDPVEFSPKDSGSNGYYVIYTSLDEEDRAVFTGGQSYKNFTLFDKKLNIYRANVGKGKNIDCVFINGVRATLARSEHASETSMAIKATRQDGSYSQSFLINGKNEYLGDGNDGYIYCDNRELLELKRPQDLRIIYYDQWSYYAMRIKEVTETEDGRVKLTPYPGAMDEGFASGVVAKLSWPEYYDNALEVLDSEGEYYYNVDEGYLYYKPHKYVDPKTMTATIPVTGDAFILRGESADNKIHNIRLDNLVFEYFDWTWKTNPNNFYVGSDRSGTDNYKSDDPLKGIAADGCLTVGDAVYIDIIDCELSKLDGAGINMRRTFQYCNIIGNHLYDIGSTGLSIGNSKHSDKGGPYDYGKYVNPTEYKYYQCNNLVKNNYVHDVARSDLSGCGIEVGFLKRSTITHNEVANSNYMGILVGGGLTAYLYNRTGIREVEISNNYVHDTSTGYNYDAGSIYMAGPSGGINGNYNQIKNNYLCNQMQAFATIYHDSGTSHYEISGNVSDQREAPNSVREVFIWARNVRKNNIHDNWSTTSNTLLNQSDNIYKPSTVVPDANWPAEAQAVVDAAGLEPEYLEKYPDHIQRTKLLSTDYSEMNIGDTLQVEVVGVKRKFNEQNLPASSYNYFSNDESVAKVDSNGLITAVGSGSCHVFAEYLDGTILRRQIVEIIVEPKVVEIAPLSSNINAIYGSTGSVKTLAYTSSYSTISIIPYEYEVEDTSVATIDDKGVIHPVAAGITYATLKFEEDGIKLEQRVKITVIKYNHGEETLKYAAEHSRALKEGDQFFNPDNWIGQGKAEASASGIGVDVIKAGPMWTTFTIKNELLSFDLEVADPTDWPGFMFNANNHNGTTSNKMGNFYLICLSEKFPELQRFDESGQVVIFGYEALKPIGGIGFANVQGGGETMGGEIYKTSGVTYSITAGAVDEPGGTRLILILNGMPIYDYLDKDGLTGGGYWGVYNDTGTFNFKPFTDQRFAGY